MLKSGEMRACILLLVMLACTNDHPPYLGDSDAALHEVTDAYIPPKPDEAGSDGATAYDLDFDGTCQSGYVPVWHFFDFQTHTPGTSSLQFLARTATTEALLDAAPSVHLATITGPDITVWTGIDIDTALRAAGQQSLEFLRIIVIEQPSNQPALVAYRQAYDCVP